LVIKTSDANDIFDAFDMKSLIDQKGASQQVVILVKAQGYGDEY